MKTIVTLTVDKTSENIPVELVEDLILGPRGQVTLKGGPTIRGNVSERRIESETLQKVRPQMPPDKTPAQIRARTIAGAKIRKIAFEDYQLDLQAQNSELEFHAGAVIDNGTSPSN